MSDDLKALIDSLPPFVNDPALRTCSQCLLQVPRATYDEHMQGHGFTTLHITPQAVGFTADYKENP